MGTCIQYARWLALFATVLANSPKAEPTKAPNMYFHGALVSEPCTLKPGDEAIELQFGPITDKYLYKNNRTRGLPIELHLQDCDISKDSTVKVLFSGTENIKLPGFLALNGNTRGFAIGLEYTDARPIMLNKQTQAWKLSKSGTIISLKAFLQIEPDMLPEQNITRGEFEGMMLFTLLYE